MKSSPVIAVSKERPTPWDRRDAAPVCITVSAVVVVAGVIEELVVPELETVAAAAAAAVAPAPAPAPAVVVVVVVTGGATNVPFPVEFDEDRVPNPI